MELKYSFFIKSNRINGYKPVLVKKPEDIMLSEKLFYLA